MIRVYLASSLNRCVHACMVATGLCRDFDVVSTWHRRAKPKDRDPRHDEERAATLVSNLAEIERCDALVALVDDGDPRCTFGEIGYALAVGKAVVWVHDSATGRNLMDAHSAVVRLDMRDSDLASLPNAIRIAAAMVSDKCPTTPAPPLGEGEFLECVESAE